jgi:hypothetical protein
MISPYAPYSTPLTDTAVATLESLLTLLPDSAAPVKTCTCCGTHHTLASWQSLRYLGDCGVPGRLVVEMRDCRCLSTLGLPVRDRHAASVRRVRGAA